MVAVASMLDVIEQLRRALIQLDEAMRGLRAGSDLCGDAASQATNAMAGSNNPEAAEIVAAMTRLVDLCALVEQRVAHARTALEQYVQRLAGDSRGPSATRPELALPADRTQPDPEPTHVRHADSVRRVQARIGRSPDGAETRGAWIKPDGSTEDVHSGKNTPWYTETERTLRRLGGPAGRA